MRYTYPMIARHLEMPLRQAATRYPVVTLTGPRQSGKTTLVREVFPEHAYVSLEAPDWRQFAQDDPRGFLGQYSGGLILDEVQRVPELLSYIQGMVDEDDQPGRFILTGSQNLLLLERVSQSLAGRAAILHLLPLSRAELCAEEPVDLAALGEARPKGKRETGRLVDTLFTGFYPRIHDKQLPPQDWLANYYQTYIERDVRSILNVGDMERFGRFVRLCAGRAGQLLNYSSLGADCGVTHETVRRWLSVLETSFIVYLLRPHHQNFSKRLVKSPKLYFYDTGLLCYLLQIRSPEELTNHSARGAVFENFVLAELLKAYYHQGRAPETFFWRDAAGHEIDILLDQGRRLVPIEVKSGETIASDFFKGLDFWRQLPEQEDAPCLLVYGGAESRTQRGVQVIPWQDWG